jgi:hypothetical protein
MDGYYQGQEAGQLKEMRDLLMQQTRRGAPVDPLYYQLAFPPPKPPTYLCDRTSYGQTTCSPGVVMIRLRSKFGPALAWKLSLDFELRGCRGCGEQALIKAAR